MTVRLTRSQAFAVAAIIALIVAALVYFVLTRQTAPPEPEEPEELTVVTAATDIGPYKTITPEMLSATDMKADAAPRGALTDPSQAIGKISQGALTEGSVLTQGDVGTRSARQGLTFIIPSGMRAVTVALDPISGVGGFVFPGDRVDVLTTFQQGEVIMTRTILQNVEVLAMNEQATRPQPGASPQATDQQGGGGDGGGGGAGGDGQQDGGAPSIQQVRSATLAVSPDEAQTLLLAAYEGAMHLALRPREDESVASLSGATKWSVMGVQPPEETPEKTEDEEQTAPEYTMPPGAMWGPGWAAANGQPQQPAQQQPQPDAEPEPEPTVEVFRGGQREVVPVP
jgi:pilus assembly protein CpaB